MNFRKIVLTVIVLSLALAMVAASGGNRFYSIKAGNDITVAYGKAGIQFDDAKLSGILKLSRPSGGFAKKYQTDFPIYFPQKLLDARFVDSQGNKVTHLKGAVYIYFQARRSEMVLYENGLVSVMYFDPWFGKWTECDTFKVGNGGTTLGCRIRVFGLYGLGIR
jgi:hypothetical protein